LLRQLRRLALSGQPPDDVGSETSIISLVEEPGARPRGVGGTQEARVGDYHRTPTPRIVAGSCKIGSLRIAKLELFRKRDHWLRVDEPKFAAVVDDDSADTLDDWMFLEFRRTEFKAPASLRKTRSLPDELDSDALRKPTVLFSERRVIAEYRQFAPAGVELGDCIDFLVREWSLGRTCKLAEDVTRHEIVGGDGCPGKVCAWID
jgi:hypothetical protein